jgi:hypothetical protein
VCKNPKISETRPDPKISGFLRSDLRNLKFYEVKPGPTPTRIFWVGGFSRVSRVSSNVAHPTNTLRGVKFLSRSFAAASTATATATAAGCYSAPVIS